MRIGCGLLALFTLLTYTPELQNFFGEHAWRDRETTHKANSEYPWAVEPLFSWGMDIRMAEPATAAQTLYAKYYLERWGQPPPPPFPQDLEETYRQLSNKLGKEPTGQQLAEANEEARFYDNYLEYWTVDYRRAFDHGAPQWSLWFHITDSTWMMVIHWCFILVTFLFMIGFCTRFTSVLAWFVALNYIHRSITTLFGVDTMMIITLLYLAIGPSGATLSVDRVISRWWRRTRHRFGFGAPADAAAPLKPTRVELERPAPSMTANLAIRLMQVHLCIIYAAAGLAKLKGESWWSGWSIWGTLANSEFAPLQNSVYAWVLQSLCSSPAVLYPFLFVGTYFTLFFEICYPFLIWNRRTRWLILSMAIVLHGGIGLLMGLRTFAFAMLVMNIVFLPAPTVYWLIGLFRFKKRSDKAGEPPRPRPEKKEPVETTVAAGDPATEQTGAVQMRVKRKK
jgi:hypothetical protein